MSYANWVEKPDGVFDIRPDGLRHPDAVFPPPCLVLNGQNERISFVFHVDFRTERVGRYRTFVNEHGQEVVRLVVTVDADGTETRQLDEEWFDCPGVHVVPLPPDHELDLWKRCQEKKNRRYKASPDGTVREVLPDGEGESTPPTL